MPKQPEKTGRSTIGLEPNPFEDLIITKIDLEGALHGLKFMDQVVLLLRYYEREKYTRIASRLSMEVDTVMRIEQRAIEKLRKKLCS